MILLVILGYMSLFIDWITLYDWIILLIDFEVDSTTIPYGKSPHQKGRLRSSKNVLAALCLD